ncbi:hypothetical protein AeRB84_006300 [Aphanomyces euteiches]|nr:hypothetical protein AeRB84_006300 [Aphanomyces euteiches]
MTTASGNYEPPSKASGNWKLNEGTHSFGGGWSARVVPGRSIPKKVIQAMVAAGAHKEHVPGGGMCVLRIDSVDSPAWQVYIDWVSIPGKGHPLAMALYYPWQFDLRPSKDKTLSVMDESKRIVNQFATLELDEFGQPSEYPFEYGTSARAREHSQH